MMQTESSRTNNDNGYNEENQDQKKIDQDPNQSCQLLIGNRLDLY